MMLDDDELREVAMSTGPKKIGSLTLRPMTPVSLSWLQRNHVFDDDQGDTIQKTAAYVFLHSQAKEVIRGVVNNRAAFADAVDDWIDETFKHHTELNEYIEHMTESMQSYLASVADTETAPADGKSKGAGAKN